ncbi:Uncharacterised protein [Achromobacter xylosoxidans]|nr:Uncharacterised protein [Achromobacter xylosoxidans]
MRPCAATSPAVAEARAALLRHSTPFFPPLSSGGHIIAGVAAICRAFAHAASAPGPAPISTAAFRSGAYPGSEIRHEPADRQRDPTWQGRTTGRPRIPAVACHARPGPRPVGGAGAGGRPGVRSWLVLRQARHAGADRGDRAPARRRPGRHSVDAARPAARQPAAAALDRQPEPGRGGDRGAAGGPGRGAPGGAEPGVAGAGRDGRRRVEGRHQSADCRLAQCASLDARLAILARRPHRRHGRPDRRQGHPELGDLQRRPQHHRIVQAAGQFVVGAEPGQRPARAAQPDTGPDRSTRHRHDRQPQRHRLQRFQPGQYAQPGRRRGGDERRPVPQRPVQWQDG